MGCFPEKFADMGPPQIQGRPPFREKFVALIDSRNTGDRAELVVEILSATCGATPSRAIPDTQVRRRSWSRHPSTPES